MIEQRKYLRTASSAMVEISHPSVGIMEFKARDLSDGGVFVYLGNHHTLPVGTIVKARIKRHTGVINEEPIEMQIIHSHSGGMGLMFLRRED